MGTRVPESDYADTHGIRLAFYQNGPDLGLPMVLCHGWPEIARNAAARRLGL
jgi:hypothetical protein